MNDQEMEEQVNKGFRQTCLSESTKAVEKGENTYVQKPCSGGRSLGQFVLLMFYKKKILGQQLSLS